MNVISLVVAADIYTQSIDTARVRKIKYNAGHVISLFTLTLHFNVHSILAILRTLVF